MMPQIEKWENEDCQKEDPLRRISHKKDAYILPQGKREDEGGHHKDPRGRIGNEERHNVYKDKYGTFGIKNLVFEYIFHIRLAVIELCADRIEVLAAHRSIPPVRNANNECADNGITNANKSIQGIHTAIGITKNSVKNSYKHSNGEKI